MDTFPAVEFLNIYYGTSPKGFANCSPGIPRVVNERLAEAVEGISGIGDAEASLVMERISANGPD